MALHTEMGFTSLRHSGISPAMPKKPALTAYLVAIQQPDGTDNVWAILAKTAADALEIAEAQEPGRAEPRIVGTLGAMSVKRMRLKPGEARII
ncbi:hypothetical protein [Methylobacterium sp. CM6244]